MPSGRQLQYLGVIKPGYFVIGATKAGTTSLCELLGEHPDVYMTPMKEPQFFSFPHRYAKGYEWYASLFVDAGDCKAVGEGSTSYSWLGVYPQVVDRLLEYSPDARIIYMVRNPLPRLESLWIEMRHHGMSIPASFAKTLRCCPEFIDSSLYSSQISQYRRRIGEQRLLVLFFEDFTADPEAQLRRCFEHLGVDPQVEIEGARDPRNVWQGKHQDGAILAAMRRVPIYNRLRDKVVPKSWRRAIKRTLVRPIEHRPQWDGPTHQWVVDRIGPDVAELLECYGKPSDYWSMDRPAAGRD